MSNEDVTLPADEDEESESAPATILEIPNMHTAFLWIAQLKQFALEKDMAYLLSLCSEGEDILTSEVVTVKCKARHTYMKYFFHSE